MVAHAEAQELSDSEVRLVLREIARREFSDGRPTVSAVAEIAGVAPSVVQQILGEVRQSAPPRFKPTRPPVVVPPIPEVQELDLMPTGLILALVPIGFAFVLLVVAAAS